MRLIRYYTQKTCEKINSGKAVGESEDLKFIFKYPEPKNMTSNPELCKHIFYIGL